MKKWQKFWFYFLIFYSFLHLIRDICQDLGLKFLLTEILKNNNFNFWGNLSTYILAFVEILLSMICLKKGKFGFWGYISLVIALITLIGWLIIYLYA